MPVLCENAVQPNTEELACVLSISATESAVPAELRVNRRSVLIVQEPPDVKQLQLEGFDLVLTWQQQHLELRQSRFFVPATPWLLPAEWPRFLSKKPGLGFLRGSKSQTAGHRLRHRIWEAREQLQSVCEVPLEFLQGGGISRDERNIQFFNQFVLVIENSRHENYFSEKLLDALLTQSMPVYWGCPNIGDFFDVAAWMNAGMVLLQSTDIDEVQFVRSCQLATNLAQATTKLIKKLCGRTANELRGLPVQLPPLFLIFVNVADTLVISAIEEALQGQTDIGQSGPGGGPQGQPEGVVRLAACAEHAVLCYMRSNASLSINEADCLLFVFAVAKPRLQRSELLMPAAAFERMALGLRLHPSQGCLCRPENRLRCFRCYNTHVAASTFGWMDPAYKQVVTFATRMKWPLLYGSIGGALILLLKMISDVGEKAEDASPHLVVVPGGGLTAEGSPPLWVRRRLQEAASLYFAYVRSGQRAAVMMLSAGTPHKPMPRDPHSGFQVLEAEANARCLIRDFNVPPQDVFEESWSLDTIGNAYMLRTTHTDIAGWRRLTIISNQFHMPRIRAIFDKVFGLGPLSSRHYSLHYREVPNDGMAQDVLEGRQAREAKSIENFRTTTAAMTTLQHMHAFLFQEHLAYSSKRLLKDREPIDAVVAGSY
ncbi:unnamed protein product [Symbiodinium sp. KB8]|nr:unnamed protein product [Symbiodinium sp. KB8]